MHLLYKEKNISSVHKFKSIAPTLVTCSGIFLLLIYSTSARHSADQTGIVELSQRYLSQIKQQLIISNNKLFAYQAFYDGSDFISAKDFYAFSKVLLKN